MGAGKKSQGPATSSRPNDTALCPPRIWQNFVIKLAVELCLVEEILQPNARDRFSINFFQHQFVLQQGSEYCCFSSSTGKAIKMHGQFFNHFVKKLQPSACVCIKHALAGFARALIILSLRSRPALAIKHLLNIEQVVGKIPAPKDWPIPGFQCPS